MLLLFHDFLYVLISLDAGCRRRYFNKHIINPVQRNGYVGEGKRAMSTLKNRVLDMVQLRRTKESVAKEINLPPLTITIEKHEISVSERDFYESIYKQSRTKFDAYVQKGTLLHNYAHIFDLLARLRQACDHPYLVVHGNHKGKQLTVPAKSRTQQVGHRLWHLTYRVYLARPALLSIARFP